MKQKTPASIEIKIKSATGFRQGIWTEIEIWKVTKVDNFGRGSRPKDFKPRIVDVLSSANKQTFLCAIDEADYFSPVNYFINFYLHF